MQKPACQEGIRAGDMVWVWREGLCWPPSTRSGLGSEMIGYFQYSSARLLLGVLMKWSSVDKGD